MSPGVAAGDAEDTRCDIYAFGALLYEMLTGDPPYAGRTLQDIRRQILAGPPKPIQERNPEADAGLRAVAEGAMARELRDRYADMGDVLADLQRIKQDKAPVGPRGLARGGLKRRIPTLAGIGIVLAAAVVALVVNNALHPDAPMLTRASIVPSTNTPVVLVPQPPVMTNPVPVVVNEPRWAVTVFAGQPGVAGSQDGAGDAARFQSPGGVAVDSAGNVYVADTGNNTIRRISPTGVVITLAGQAGSHGGLDRQGKRGAVLGALWNCS